MGLRVPFSMAPNWRTSTSSPGASSGSPMDMTKSTCGRASATTAARVTSSSRARRRSPLAGSRT